MGETVGLLGGGDAGPVLLQVRGTFVVPTGAEPLDQLSCRELQQRIRHRITGAARAEPRRVGERKAG